MTRTPSSPVQAEALEARGAFIRARLGSLLAFAPLGTWTVLHVWQNLSAFQGAEAWQASVTGHTSPASLLFTSVVVTAPLLIHGAWGLARLTTSSPNNLRYGYFNNLKYLLQRASSVGVLLFLMAHVWLAFLQPRLIEGHPEAFAELAHEMRHNGPTMPVYVLGTLGVAYHLANGIYTFSMSWGIVTGRGGLKNVERLAYVIFALLLAGCWATLYALWSAGA
jgi:succinate dehydrogenase / fumarate reductase, cytochrome b subunit